MSFNNKTKKSRRRVSFRKMVNKSTFEVIQQLENDGKLNQLVRKGVIAIDWIDHLKIYRDFKKYLDQGNGVMESYKIAATINSVHYNTVIYIRKKMES